MLGGLTLINFKTHKNTTLKFSPGINVITGDTGQGKTNILLALQLVKDNRPLGSGYIRRGQESTEVRTEVIDGNDACSVVRRRGTSENSYDIEKGGVSIVGKESLTAFGNSPPGAVSEILNLSDINVQKQRDQHFLVYSPPGQIATYVRSITKLDEIDRVTKSLSGKIRTVNGEIAHYESELESANKKLAILNRIDLELLESKIEEAKNRVLKIKQIEEKAKRIKIIVSALKTLEENRICIPDNIDQIFEDVDFGQKVLAKTTTHLSALRILVDKIKKIRACKITLPKDLKILFTVEPASEKYENIRERINVFHTLLEEIYIVEIKIENSDNQLKKLRCEEKQLMEELTSCPECGVELTEESKKVLLEK